MTDLRMIEKLPDKFIIPVRLDSYNGDTTSLEVEFYGREFPDNRSMWIAVWVIEGKVKQELTDYGYRSLNELLEAYKDMPVLGYNPDEEKEG